MSTLNTLPSLKTIDLPETITEQSVNELINDVFAQLDTPFKSVLSSETGEAMTLGNDLINDITVDAKETMRNELLNMQKSETTGESIGDKQTFDVSGIAFNTDKSFRSTITNFKNTVDANITLSDNQKNALYGKANYLLTSLDLTIGLALMNVNAQGGEKMVQGFFSFLKNAVKIVVKVVTAVVIGVAVLVSTSAFTGFGAYAYAGAVGYGGYLYYSERIVPWIDSWW
ncbi:hypothetical protein D3C80_1295210 [compost metagenome]